jgi:hypothetical protein
MGRPPAGGRGRCARVQAVLTRLPAGPRPGGQDAVQGTPFRAGHEAATRRGRPGRQVSSPGVGYGRPGTLMTTLFAVAEMRVAPVATTVRGTAMVTDPVPACPNVLVPHA